MFILSKKELMEKNKKYYMSLNYPVFYDFPNSVVKIAVFKDIHS